MFTKRSYLNVRAWGREREEGAGKGGWRGGGREREGVERGRGKRRREEGKM